MNPIQLADKYFGNYITKGDEIIPDYCPFCHGGKNHNKKTFALNINENRLTYNCKRGTCGAKGAFFQLCHHFGEKSDEEIEFENNSHYKKKPKSKSKPKKEYNLKVPEISDISPTIEKYMALRGITKETLIKLNVKQTNGNITFIYTEDGVPVLYKHKFVGKPEKKKGQIKSWQSGGGKAVLWRLDECDPSEPLVIVEGEPDAMIIWQSGYKNVVSVPFGVADMSWIENNWDRLEEFKEIIFWGDNDEPDRNGVRPGEKMVRIATARLGESRCKICHSPYKDANVHHFKEGAESVLEVIHNATMIPVSDLLNLAEVEEFNPNALEKIPTGFNQVDRVIGGNVLGTVNVITGKSGAGKSTAINTMISTAVDKGYKVGVYSGELKASFLRYWLELVMAGSSNVTVKHNGDDAPDSYYIDKEARDIIKDWYNDKIFVYDNTKTNDAYTIIDRMEQSIQRYGVKLLILDNLMTMKFNCSESGLNKAHSDFIQELTRVAKKYDISIVLVHHPRKTSEWVRSEDLKGTGDLFNAADAVLVIHRVNSIDAEMHDNLNEGENIIEVLKNRIFSIVDKKFAYEFDIASKRFFNSKTNRHYQYGWEKNYKKSKQMTLLDKEGFKEVINDDSIPF